MISIEWNEEKEIYEVIDAKTMEVIDTGKDYNELFEKHVCVR